MVLKYADFETSSKAIFDACTKLIGAPAGYVALLTPDKKENLIVFLNPGGYICTVDPTLPMPIRGMRGEVVKSKKALINNNFQETDWIHFLPKGHVGLKNVMFTPLIFDDQVQGLMGMANKPGGFTEDDKNLAMAFTEFVSIALQNSQTLEFLEKSQKRYKNLSQVLEQKVIERTKKLHESEEKFRRIFESIPDLFFLVNSDGKIIDYSTGKNSLYFKSESFIGKEITSIMPKDKSEIFLGKIRETQYTRNPIVVEFTLPFKNIPRYFEGRNLYFSDDQIAIFVRDITERKHIENALQSSETELAAIYEYAPIAILLVDKDARIRKANRIFIDFANYELEDIIGLKSGDALSCLNALNELGGCGSSQECPNCMINKTILNTFNKGTPHFGIEANIPFELNGSKTLKNFIISTIRINIKSENFVLLTINDITKLKKAEENLRKLMEDLKRSNTDLEQFAYVTSHDLQEPLRMIASFTQLLEKRYKDRLDEDANEFIHFIVDGAKRMQMQIMDLLAYSRVGTHARAFRPTDTDIVLKNILSNLKPLIQESNALISNDPLPVIIADETQLAQLFQNLISNAIKFKRKNIDPKIHISGETNQQEWLFSIQDNGIGIDKKYLDRIFGIFQRLHKRENYDGTGIGLAICKKIIQRHGGRIWAESI